MGKTHNPQKNSPKFEDPGKKFCSDVFSLEAVKRLHSEFGREIEFLEKKRLERNLRLSTSDIFPSSDS